MGVYDKIAVYDIRKVLWQELQYEGLIDINDYYADGFSTALIPIIPAQQVPEFNNLLPGKTYIIYDVLQKNFGVQYWMSQETVTFSVTSTSSSEIQSIIAFITDFFRRYDKSAGDVNLRLVEGSPFTFYWFNLETADPVQAFQNEGGLMTGLVSIRYAYSRDLDPLTGRYA